MNIGARKKELNRLEKDLLKQEKPQDDNLLILNSESFDEAGTLTPRGYSCLKEQGRFIDPLHNVIIDIPKNKSDGFSKSLKAFATKEIISIRKEERFNNKISILLLIVGAFFIAVSYFFNYSWVVQEIFVVASWVFTWMAVERICFERIGFKHRKMRILQIVDAEVVNSKEN